MRMLITILTIAFFSGLISVCFAKEENFCSNQILARETKSGFTWTLTSRLGEILHSAEKRYGKRDMSWTILGIEFTNQDQPEIWYPSPSDNRKHVIIQLTKKASQDKKSAIYQLSHEVIHLLSPAGRDGSSVFEEGLAVYFAISNMQTMNYDINERYISGKKYKQAYKLIDNLYKNFDNAEARIKQLRSKVKRTRDISPQQFSAAFEGLNKQYAQLLATKYSDWKL